MTEKIDEAGIVRILLGVPAIHLFLCYYYLFFRSFGFGSNLTEFIGAGDVLTVGLGKLLWTYLLFAMSTVSGHLWMDADPLQVVGRTEMHIHPSLNRRSMFFLFESIPYITAVAIFITLITQHSILLGLVPFILIPGLAKFAHKFTEKNNYSYLVRSALIMFPIGMMNLAASAYSDGFRARTRPIEFFADANARCRDGTVVLFSAGSKFVGIEDSGARLLLNEECKKFFSFPTSRVVIDVI